MISMPKTFSAEVELYLHLSESRIELGHLGPGFALLSEPQEFADTEGEIETIIDGRSQRTPIRITTPPTTENRRFSFEGVG